MTRRALAAVGTPEGMPDAARAGFGIVVDRARDGEVTGPPGPADEAKVAAFQAYVSRTCGGEELGLPEVPSLQDG